MVPTLIYICIAALVFGGWLWSKISGKPIDNREAWERKFPKRQELRAMPYRFRWWHLLVFGVQAAFVVGLTAGFWQKNPASTPIEVLAIAAMWAATCAFLTACITQCWDWVVIRLRRLRRHRSEPSDNSLRSIGTGRLVSKTPEQRERIGVRD